MERPQGCRLPPGAASCPVPSTWTGVAQAQLENQVGPGVAEVATGRGKGRLGTVGSHSRVLVSAMRGGLVLGTSDGPQEGRGAGCWDPAKLVALQCMWPREPSVSLGSSAGGRGSPPRKFKETKSLHPSELWFSLAAWVPTHGPVPPGPPVHSCRHWALALSSSLCTVLYSTWKCWTAVYAMPRYAPMHTASSRSKMAGLTL